MTGDRKPPAGRIGPCEDAPGGCPPGFPPEILGPRRRTLLTPLVALATATLLTPPSDAQLSILRKGKETVDVPDYVGDRMGEAVCAGDFNGDGRDDRSDTTALNVLTLEVYYRDFTPLLQVK